MRSLAIGAAVLALCAAGLAATHLKPGSSTTPVRHRAPTLAGARSLFLRELQQKLNGKWAAAWSSLYPSHQRLAPRVVYVRCEATTPFPAALRSLGVIRVRRVPVRVPGVARLLPGAAITVRVALRWYGPRDSIVLEPTFHLVAVNGGWRWTLSAERYRQLRDRTCGALPPA